MTVMSNTIVRITRLVFQLEPIRFMQRGLTPADSPAPGLAFPPQPVAMTTAMGQQLVQSGALGPRGLEQVFARNAPLNPAAQGPLPQNREERIAVSFVRITNIVEQVRHAWSDWKIQTSREIQGRLRQMGADRPRALEVVPTRQAMRQMLEQFYGQAVNIRMR
jgi:hypothetical protein